MLSSSGVESAVAELKIEALSSFGCSALDGVIAGRWWEFGLLISSVPQFGGSTVAEFKKGVQSSFGSTRSKILETPIH